MNAIIIGSSKPEVDVLKVYIEKLSMVTIVATYDNPEAEDLPAPSDDIDMMFVDGDLVGERSLDVFDFFEASIPVVVFSKNDANVLKSFDAGAVDYLLLPGSFDRFLRAIKRAERMMNCLNKKPVVKDMYVRSNSKSLRVPFDSVLYIEAMADYVIIQAEDCKYIVHYTMKGIQDKLPSDRFVRVHRSYIVNMDKIHAIDNQEVLIKEKRIPIGASNKDYFFSRLNLI